MSRRVEVVKLDEGYLVKAWARTEAEAAAVQGAALRVVTPAAFQPVPESGSNVPKPGIPFDPPEEPAWPSDTNARWYPEDTGQLAYPPNCDGNRAFDEALTRLEAGTLLAHAQHEAAIDGDGCTSAGCLITRGSD